MKRLPHRPCRHWCLLGLAAGAWPAAAQQAPGLKVEVVTMASNYLPVADAATFGAGVLQAHGLTTGTAAAATAQAGAGLLNRLAGPDPAQPDLGASVDIDAGLGRMRMTAFGDLLGQAGATATWYDTLAIVPGAAPLDWRVRVNLQAFEARGDGNEARFFVGVSAWNGAAYDLNLFGFGGTTTASAQGVTSSGLLFTPAGGQTLAQVPMQIDVAFQLPALPILGNQLHLRWQFSAGAGGAPGGQALVGAGQSAWLGIDGDYTSLGGYSYPGYSAPVPEAGTAALLAVGGLVLGGAVRRRRA